jgi:hypothetical protein
VTGGREDKDGRINWQLIISIAALLFGVVPFVREMNNNSEAKAVAMEKRICRLEAADKVGECGR